MATSTTLSDALDIDPAERSGSERRDGAKRVWRGQLARWLALSLLLHLVAAHFSEGFYHPDEHWQTLEFMSCHLGRTPCDALPWEYAERIRSWSQPFLYAQLARLWLALGVDSPSDWARGFRIASALVGWASLAALACALPRWIARPWLRRWGLIGLATLWCLPYLHARTSSENLGGSFLAFGLASLALLPARAAAAFATGALLGLAFELRFQTGFASLGIALWALTVERWPAPRALALASGALGMVALATLLDSRLYGAWTFAPWNYLDQNLLAGRLSGFGGPEPWYYYANRAGWVLAPLTPALLVLVAVACVRRRRSAPVWAFVTFVLAHGLFSHKSLRFFFPLVPLVPVLAAMGLDGWRVRGVEISPAQLRRPLARAFVALCLAVNAAALLVVSLRPPHYPTGLYAHLYAEAPRPLDLHFARGHPFSEQLAMPFYHLDWIRLRPAASLAAFTETLDHSATPLWLFDPVGSLPAGLRERCVLAYASHPRWLRTSRLWRRLSGRARMQLLYRCEP